MREQNITSGVTEIPDIILKIRIHEIVKDLRPYQNTSTAPDIQFDSVRPL